MFYIGFWDHARWVNYPAIFKLVFRNAEVVFFCCVPIVFALLSTSSGDNVSTVSTSCNFALLNLEVKWSCLNSTYNVPNSDFAVCAVDAAWNACKVSPGYWVLLISSYFSYFKLFTFGMQLLSFQWYFLDLPVATFSLTVSAIRYYSNQILICKGGFEFAVVQKATPITVWFFWVRNPDDGAMWYSKKL